MLLGNHGNTAATACNDNLVGIGKRSYSINFYNINGGRRRYHTSVALTLFLCHIIAFFDFDFRIILGHIAADLLGRLIKSFVIGVHSYLG